MRLVRRTGRLASPWLAVLALAAAPSVAQARHPKSEAELRARIERESNPVKKAKLEIELGDLKLSQGASAFDHDEDAIGTKLLDSYLDCMQSAWKFLQASGRNAAKKPQGFMALDIALRENRRFLFDLQERTPYEQSLPISGIAGKVVSLHNQVLAALFPGGKFGTAPVSGREAAGSPIAPAEPPQ